MFVAGVDSLTKRASLQCLEGRERGGRGHPQQVLDVYVSMCLDVWDPSAQTELEQSVYIIM